MKHFVKNVAQIGLVCFSMSLFLFANEHESKTKELKEIHKEVQRVVTADHSKFEQLKKPFKSGKEVTQACVGCHNKASDQFKKTVHWTWQSPDDHRLGKGQNSMNNYCISTNQMKDHACIECHTSWDYVGTEGTVNCLKCHAGILMKWDEAFSDIEGLEVDPEDEESMEFAKEIRDELTASITSIGPTRKENCGNCHFKGGGGEAVKHGDLDSSLLNATRELDVHMARDGQNFTCSRCHTTHLHNITGRVYGTAAVKEKKALTQDDQASRIACISCHTEQPHSLTRLNNHTRTLSCQACHIPEVAKEEPTMVAWDWSTAGKRKDGRAYVEVGEYGHHFYSYKSIKGTFTWKKHVIPEYRWYNGKMKQMTFEDKVDPSKIVEVNHPEGDANDSKARIYPFKVMRTNQPYDKVNKILAAPLLSTREGFWTTLDWPSAMEKGMALQGLKYSGEMGFVNTEFSYSMNHMVSPKEDALKCAACHVGSGGRMEQISGIYIPTKDHNVWVDRLGIISVVMSLFGVIVHGLLRYVGNKKIKKETEA